MIKTNRKLVTRPNERKLIAEQSVSYEQTEFESGCDYFNNIKLGLVGRSGNPLNLDPKDFLYSDGSDNDLVDAKALYDWVTRIVDFVEWEHKHYSD